MPSFRGSSQPRDQSQISHIAGGFFTSWATREAQGIVIKTAHSKTVISTVWYWHKNRHIGQRKRIESPENNHMFILSSNISQGINYTQWIKYDIFNKRYKGNWIYTCEGTKLDSSLTLLTEINLKLIKYLNVRPETIKL